jgi:hypothetical protein
MTSWIANNVFPQHNNDREFAFFYVPPNQGTLAFCISKMMMKFTKYSSHQVLQNVKTIALVV